MKTLVTLLILSVCTCLSSYSQTQGDQELSWVKRIYAKEYVPQAYPRFIGAIEKESDFSYRFKDRIVLTYEYSQELEYILLNGLLYPQLITGDSTIKFDPENSLSRILRNDTLTLGNFKQVNLETKDFKVKQFSFYVSQQGIMNPGLYTLEISNEKGEAGTSLADFYKGAKTTFWKFVSVLL